MAPRYRLEGGYVRLEEAWRTCVGDKKSGGKIKRRVWRKGKYVGCEKRLPCSVNRLPAGGWKRTDVGELMCVLCVCASSLRLRIGST